jgi:mRNA-degrading endonuclease RelE of RelBE toxin-antitoxin system
MNSQQIISHCISKLSMTCEQAEWVSENLYNYSVPDWSEMSWDEINQSLRDTLAFKPIQTEAGKLRVGDTFRHMSGHFRVIAAIDRSKPLVIVVTNDLGESQRFNVFEQVETQLLQLL